MSERLILEDVPLALWDDFHAGRAIAQREHAVAWSRARTLGAPPAGADPEELLRGDDLRLHLERVELLPAIGAAILERAAARAARHDFLLLLADADGVVVSTSGGGAFADTAREVRLIEGACWSEASRGTNAIGTAVAANRPTEVHGRAHFGRSYHQLVCYAAPVCGLDGVPLAVIDATSRIERADPILAHIVTEAARGLEELIRLRGYAAVGASITRALARSLDHMRDPALIVEAPGRIARANGSARALLAGGGLAALGVGWFDVVREATLPTAGGLALEVGAQRRAWRLRAEPIASPDGHLVATLVILEPGRVVAAAAPRALPVDPFATIFAEDDAVRAAIAWSGKLATSDLPIMLLAETGAGKELFARAIHEASPRANGPWHAVNCGALSPSLLESELFGYEPGAFTGADRAGRTGLFHAADGGTLFLDEVAEMSPAMQAALLRVVESGTFRRIGGTRLERTDVRILCATCRDLPALVATEEFRRDLYYRLKGAAVRIPPLRERSDIAGLARHLLGNDFALAPDAADAIAHHAWPGNVRELKSALAIAKVAAAGGRWIELAHLPPELSEVPADEPSPALERAEREALVRALAEAGGNLSRAAKTLGVARSTLYRLKRRHGLA